MMSLVLPAAGMLADLVSPVTTRLRTVLTGVFAGAVLMLVLYGHLRTERSTR